MINAQSSALAAQDFGCLAPSSRHLCSNGSGTASSTCITLHTTYMPALTGFRPLRLGVSVATPVFKSKKPSRNAKKLLKVNKGKLRVFDTPRGVSQKNPVLRYPLYITNHWPSVTFRKAKSKIHHLKPGKFTPQNLRLMPYFRRSQFFQ